MSEFIEKSKALPVEMIKRFKSAVETGKWPDGSPVTEAQREIALQAVIAYENEHVDASVRTAALDSECASKKQSKTVDDEQVIATPEMPNGKPSTKH